MKKQVKVISMVLIVMFVMMSLSTVVLGLSDKIDKIGAGSESAATAKVEDLGGKIVSILQVVGIVVAIVVLLVLGIKYMMGSAEEKAEYKKTMIPYVIGAILLFAATTIVNMVYNVAQSL